MPNLEWADSLEALWGTPLTDRQVGIWEHYLRGMDSNGVEIIEAIEAAAQTDEKIRFRATVRDLQRWIEILRRNKRKQGRAEDAASRKKHFVAEWKEKLSRGAKEDDFYVAAERLRIDTGMKITDFNDLLGEVLDG